MRSVPETKTIEIILQTPGGSAAAAEIIVNAMLNHKGQVIVYVPQYAMSAGTLIALAADEIYLGKNAYMGPADPQFRFGYSAVSILDYSKQFEGQSRSWITDVAALVGYEAKKSINWIKELITRIYSVRERELTDEVTDLLFSGKYSHERPLFYQDLIKVIPFVREGIPDEIYNLH